MPLLNILHIIVGIMVAFITAMDELYSGHEDGVGETLHAIAEVMGYIGCILPNARMLSALVRGTCAFLLGSNRDRYNGVLT